MSHLISAMPPFSPADATQSGASTLPSCSWTERYGERHRQIRIRDFPAGIQAPKKVRLYRRRGHYVLQWWDPRERRTLSDRVDGDLVAAITKARQIEDRLSDFRSAGPSRARRLGHAELVEEFLADLGRRADAGEIDVGTVGRYAAALRHYQDFCSQPTVSRKYCDVAKVDREFRLEFDSFLAGRCVVGNGRLRGSSRPMRGQGMVRDTVRAMFAWASDPDRGRLLSDGFRNPFLRPGEARPVLLGDPLADPDISLAMAVALVRSCDHYQFRLFVPMLLFGLRAAEPCFLFAEHLDGEWLRVPCLPDLDYQTKGRRDKRFPLIDDLATFWSELRIGRVHGLLYERRGVAEGREDVPLRGAALSNIVAEFRRRCEIGRVRDAAGRRRVRGDVLRDAGGLTYDHVEAEFNRLATQLGWPSPATPKDLRHLFATSLNNAAIPDAYRRYLMGHAPGRAALTAYTHLNELRRHYATAIRREWTPLIEAVLGRLDAAAGHLAA
jgi:hypothetical protein